METSILKIFFKVSSPFYEDVIELSRELKESHGSTFFADGKTFFPHLPVYLMEVPSKNIEKVVKASTPVASECEQFDAVAGNLKMTGSGLVMVSIEMNEYLKKYHEIVVKKLNPFREGVLPSKYKDPDYLPSLDKKPRANVLEYGHEFIFDLYDPHITVGWFDDVGNGEKVVQSMGNVFSGRTFEVEELWVSEEHPKPLNRSEILLRVRMGSQAGK